VEFVFIWVYFLLFFCYPAHIFLLCMQLALFIRFWRFVCICVPRRYAFSEVNILESIIFHDQTKLGRHRRPFSSEFTTLYFPLSNTLFLATFIDLAFLRGLLLIFGVPHDAKVRNNELSLNSILSFLVAIIRTSLI